VFLPSPPLSPPLSLPDQCPVGSYWVASCTQCPAGRYGLSAGLTAPACSGPCDAGRSGIPGATSSLCGGLCGLGTYSLAGDVACSNCPPGLWECNVQEASLLGVVWIVLPMCDLCRRLWLGVGAHDGGMQRQLFRTLFVACLCSLANKTGQCTRRYHVPNLVHMLHHLHHQAGYYCEAGSQSSSPTPCPAGYACPPSTGNGTQFPCPPGTYSAGGAETCSPCPAGRWGGSASAGSATCSGACAAGE
jgi:hypothetical protein